jgi:hypothetical protein
MQLKSGINKTKDIIYISIAILLTIIISVYLFWLVKHLADTANKAFDSNLNSVSIPSFDFKRYDALMKKISPSTSTARISGSLLNMSSSTASSTR